MPKKLILGTLSTMIIVGIAQAQSSSAIDTTAAQIKKTEKKLSKDMPRGFEKCYGIAKAGMNDCATGTTSCAGSSTIDNAKNTWVGLPKGTCNRIVGGNTTQGSA